MASKTVRPIKSIKPTPYFGNAALEIERAELDTEFLHQELPKIGFHLVVAGTSGEMMQEFSGPRIIGQRFLDLGRLGGSACLRSENLVDNDAKGETHVNFRSIYDITWTGRTTCRPWHVHPNKTCSRPIPARIVRSRCGSPAYRPEPDKVRAQLHRILAEARAAEKLPWDDDKVLLYRTIFPHMAGWLPEEEGRQLRFEFDTEMARLKAA